MAGFLHLLCRVIHPFILYVMAQTKTIRGELNGLRVGGVSRFPITRYDYVVSCKTRLQVTTGKKFSSHIDKHNGLVEITRSE